MHHSLSWRRLAAAVLALSGLALAQTEVRTRTVVVNGQSQEATIYEIDGRSFIDLETLAKIGGGSLRVQGNQIVVTLPANPANAPASATANSPPADTRLSDPFMKAGIQDLAILENVRTTLTYGVQRGIPGDGRQMAVVLDKAAEGLRLAGVAASTDSDRSALQLLTNQFINVRSWFDQLLARRNNMDATTYSASALNNDPLYQNIVSCSTFLGTMLPSGTFTDDGSCNNMSTAHSIVRSPTVALSLSSKHDSPMPVKA
jgi:hypothetical protein